MLPTIAAEVTLFRLEEKGEGALADFAERSKHLFLSPSSSDSSGTGDWRRIQRNSANGSGQCTRFHNGNGRGGSARGDLRR